MNRKVACFLTFISSLFISLSATAQTEQGKLLLGGNTGFSSVSMKTTSGNAYYNTYDDKQTSMEFTPEFGLFVARNFVIGLAVRYKSNELKTGYQTYSSKQFYAIPIARVYFGKQTMKPYLYGGIGLGSANESDSGYGTAFDNVNKHLFLTEVGGGIAAFVNNSVSIEIGAAWSSVTSKYSDNIDKAKGIGFQIGIVLCL